MLAKLLTIGATVLLSLSAATNAQQPAYPTVASRALWLPVTPVANYTLAAMQHVGAQPKSQSQYIPGTYWGPAGPWADQDPICHGQNRQVGLILSRVDGHGPASATLMTTRIAAVLSTTST